MLFWLVLGPLLVKLGCNIMQQEGMCMMEDKRQVLCHGCSRPHCCGRNGLWNLIGLIALLSACLLATLSNSAKPDRVIYQAVAQMGLSCVQVSGNWCNAL